MIERNTTSLCAIASIAAMDLQTLYYPEEFMIDLECQLIHLYYTVILKDTNLNFAYLTPFYLNKVKEAFKKTTLRGGNSSIYFNTPGYRSAYLYQYSPCFTSAVAFHFEKLLNIKDENFCLFDRVILKNSVNICCLGGGPCTEFVAIAKVFELMIKRHYPRTRHPLKMCVTIIDIDAGWQNTAGEVWISLFRFINTSLVNFEMNFIKADLTKPFSKDVQDALRKSDVVTMVKLLSAIQGTESKDRILPMIEEVHQCIPEDGVVFLLDSTAVMANEGAGNILNSFQDLLSVYGPIHHTYNMSNPAKNVCFDLYFEYYGWQCCTTETKNYVSAWQKCSLDYFQKDTPPVNSVKIIVNSPEKNTESRNVTDQIIVNSPEKITENGNVTDQIIVNSPEKNTANGNVTNEIIVNSPEKNTENGNVTDQIIVNSPQKNTENGNVTDQEQTLPKQLDSM